MAKIRVGQLAKELSIKVSEALTRLQELGVEVKTNLSTVDDESAARLRAAAGSGSDKKPGRPAGAAEDKGARARASSAPAATVRARSTTAARPARPKTSSPVTTDVRHTVAPAGMKKAGAAGSGSPAATTRAQAPASPKGAATKGRTSPGAGTPAGAPVRTSVSHAPPAGARRPAEAPSGKLGTARPAPVTQTRPTAGMTPGARPAPRPAGAPAGTRPGALGARPATAGVPRPQSPPGRPIGGPTGAPSAQRPRPQPTTAQSQRPSQRPIASAPAARTRPAPPPPQAVPTAVPIPPEELKELRITEGVTVKELSEKMTQKAKDLITRLITKGFLATINQPLDVRIASELCREFGFDAKVISFEEEVKQAEAETTRPADLRLRDPVITIMGHVDHGKTSLLDAIRASNVVAGEAGGITQHIGAYHIRHGSRGISFIDTPGHEAFTMMRARGARVTDLVVLVVAADDGVMPQTVEAIDHARAAAVPIVVAINKVDKPGGNIDRIKKQLSDHGLLVEDWGGQVVAVPISAKQKTGINELLEMTLLVADMSDLNTDPTCLAAGTVLESRLDRARGPVATILVQRGTLRVGDPFIAGAVHGKVRAMFDDLGHRIKEAGPSIPVEVLGLEGVPMAGDPFQVLEEEWKVRQIGAFRQQKLRQASMAKSSRLTLDHLHQQIKEGTVKELPLVVKADVQGSVEALTKTLTDLPSEKVKLRVIHAASGGISETDVLLASASNAIIIGYNVRPDRGAQDLAEKEKVDIRLHSVIYDITNEIKNAMVGLLDPESKEVVLGRAEVRQTFKVPKMGTIAGCMVADGKAVRNGDARLLRDGVVIYTGKIGSLKRFKDDASEVKAGYECGIGLANYNDLKTGDVIEMFRVEKVAAKSL